jgi:hypothetical protein
MDVGVTLGKIGASSELSGSRSRDIAEMLESYIDKTCVARGEVRDLRVKSCESRHAVLLSN